MSKILEKLSKLKDDELERGLMRLCDLHRRTVAAQLAFLSEIQRREIHLRKGYASMFDYCVRKLGMSNDEAGRRIHAARAAKQFPALYRRLKMGHLTLSTVSRLAPVLKPENHQELISRAAGKTVKEVERIVAEIRPQPPRRDVMRAASPTTVRIAFDAGPETAALLERAQGLLRHAHPQGRLEDVVATVLRHFLKSKDPARQKGRDTPPPPHGRRVPAALKRRVWRRDGGRCAYVGGEGRCAATQWLEVDHVMPWALGGRTAYGNLRLLCRAHNQRLSRFARPAASPRVRERPPPAGP